MLTEEPEGRAGVWGFLDDWTLIYISSHIPIPYLKKKTKKKNLFKAAGQSTYYLSF